MSTRPSVNVVEMLDTRDGIPSLLSNIDVWCEVSRILCSTLGPYGRDKLIMCGEDMVVTNDGATILKNLNLTHPAGRLLCEISESQDSVIGDGTTSVVLLSSAILESLKELIKSGFNVKEICSILDEVNKFVDEVVKRSIISYNKNELLKKVASTALTSKVLKYEKELFSDIIVSMCEKKNYGIKKIIGSALKNSELVEGVAFEKTFSYAGHEQLPKKIKNGKILLTTEELEWKSERENAEIRINIEEYQKVVNAEWSIIKKKLENIVNSGCNIIFSTQSIGDYATQYFARNKIFCAGRVKIEDMKRMESTCECNMTASSNYIIENNIGECELFEEKQIGKYRYNFIIGKKEKTCTLLLRGAGKEIVDEAERSLADGLCVVKKMQGDERVVAGGGAIDMKISKEMRDRGKEMEGRKKLVYRGLAQAFEIIPKTLCDNFGIDNILVIQELRAKHCEGNNGWGVCMKGVENMENLGVVEPLAVKQNMYKAAITAAKTLLSVDTTYVTKNN